MFRGAQSVRKPSVWKEFGGMGRTRWARFVGVLGLGAVGAGVLLFGMSRSPLYGTSLIKVPSRSNNTASKVRSIEEI